MMERTLTWAIQKIVDIADGLDERNLHEFIEDLRHDPCTVIEAAANALEGELEKRVEDKGLCPKCFTEMQVAYKTSYCSGYSYPEPKGTICPECGRKGDAQ